MNTITPQRKIQVKKRLTFDELPQLFISKQSMRTADTTNVAGVTKQDVNSSIAPSQPISQMSTISQHTTTSVKIKRHAV